VKSFLDYYREELISLRRRGGDFAKRHPEIARRLDIKDGESADPQTERIIESVAFMSAKLDQKIDDNVQSIAFQLLSALYPNLVSTFPPCGIVRFDSSTNISNSNKVVLPKWTNLFARSASGSNCAFKTIYPISLYPIEISGIEVSEIPSHAYKQFIEIKINTMSVPIEQIKIDNLLFYINSEIVEDSLLVYESIFLSHKKEVFIRICDSYLKIDDRDIVQCGFSDDEVVCPVHKYTSNTFQLFQESLHFKRKFMFFRILNIDKYIDRSGLKNIDELSIFLKMNFVNEKVLSILKIGSIILNAVPIVNLFSVMSDPFKFDGTKNKYLLVADRSRDRSIEIHSVTEVTIVDSETQELNVVQPYFSLAVDSDTNVVHDIFWIATREPSEIRGLNGFDTYISFVENKINHLSVYSNIAYAKTLCTNRSEALAIPSFARVDIESADSAGYFGTLLYRMTESVTTTNDGNSLWCLISQISSTHISVARGENLLSSISKLLAILAGSSKLNRDEELDWIEGIEIKKTARRIGSDAWRGFVSGLEVEMSIIDNELSPGKFLLLSVLNQYLSSSVSINSFVELLVKSKKTGQIITQWHPTSGRLDLL
jgi:type VI secretion system protein ImpG